MKNLDKFVHEAAAHMAAKINNSGTQDQVDFLVKTYGWSEEDIDDVAVESAIGNEALDALRALRRTLERPGFKDGKRFRKEVKIAYVKIHLCNLCLEGTGKVCNTPGCAFCWHDSPGFPIDPHLYEILHEIIEDDVPKFSLAERPRASGKKGAARRGERR